MAKLDYPRFLLACYRNQTRQKSHLKNDEILEQILSVPNPQREENFVKWAIQPFKNGGTPKIEADNNFINLKYGETA